jgi:2-polyprenyl-6-methoxyphenol hydroxylase-like FAD-dependent oxidoreductase
MQTSPRVIIIGGGIGGLALALALKAVGCRCEVFEQGEALREVGAGLTIWANALRALEQLGVAQRVLPLASKLGRFEVRTWRGEVVSALSFAGLEQALACPVGVVIHRADLLRELAAGLSDVPVHCGARCVGIEEHADGVIVRFADGRMATGDLLVGADGIHSVVRAHLHGASRPRYAGYTCWRGVANLDLLDSALGMGFEAWGSGARFAVLPCGPGRVSWYATVNAPEGGIDSPAGRKADVLGVVCSWHAPIRTVIEASPESGILRNDVVDRPPLRNWGRGRITLLGDAAHPTTPNLGQGACQAIEDAVWLAASLSLAEAGAGAGAGALRRYERARFRRTAGITRESWWMGSVTQWESPLARALRNLLTSWTPEAVSLRLMAARVNVELPTLRGPAAGPARTHETPAPV